MGLPVLRVLREGMRQTTRAVPSVDSREIRITVDGIMGGEGQAPQYHGEPMAEMAEMAAMMEAVVIQEEPLPAILMLLMSCVREEAEGPEEVDAVQGLAVTVTTQVTMADLDRMAAMEQLVPMGHRAHLAQLAPTGSRAGKEALADRGSMVEAGVEAGEAVVRATHSVVGVEPVPVGVAAAQEGKEDMAAPADGAAAALSAYISIRMAQMVSS